jgi:predicted TIM-barrel fold metal-dependent hydrolase
VDIVAIRLRQRGEMPMFKLPKNACDTHCHIFGPSDRYPYIAKRAYTPADAPKEVLAALHAKLGVDRAVIVQASIHGSDNRPTLEAMRSDPARYRGVAMIDDETTDRELREMHEAGILGIRFNFNRNLGGFPDMDLVVRSVARVRDMGWHLVMQVDGVDVPALTPFIRSLPVPFVIDHMGRCDVNKGIGQPDFLALLDLMKLEGAWIKISCPERMQAPPYAGVVRFARALLAARPDRVIWGTDFPHPNLKVPPDDVELVNMVPRYAPTAAEQHRLLVANPARLYRFPE